MRSRAIPVGTVPHLAPEEVRGGAVDARTDLFAFKDKREDQRDIGQKLGVGTPLEEGEQWGFQFAEAHAGRGEVDEAFRWLERAYELHDSGVVLVKVSWALESLHSDPRWPRFLERIGLGD